MVVHPDKRAGLAQSNVCPMKRARRMRLRRLLSDPFSRSIILSVTIVVAGFVAIGIGWRGAARSVVVAEQLAFLVSGGVGGLALVMAGAGLLVVQSSRYWNARERRRLEELADVATKFFEPR